MKVTKEMIYAGDIMAWHLINIDIINNMGGLAGARTWEDWLKEDIQNKDLAIAYAEDKMESVEAVYIAMERARNQLTMPDKHTMKETVQRPQDAVRKACIAAYNMPYSKFKAIFDMEDDGYYTIEKFDLMKRDFSKWFCGLDSVNAEKFMKSVEEKED